MIDPSDAAHGLSPAAKREFLRELLRKGGRSAELPVSAGQRALWFMHQLDPSSPAYNVMSRWEARSSIDPVALKEAFQQLVDRHDVLRTTFEATTVPDQPIRRVHDRQAVWFEHIQAGNPSSAEITALLYERACVPFDLARGPVCRAELFSRADGQDILLLTCHHIAYDHGSLKRLMADWVQLYAAIKAGQVPALPRLEARYADYVRWQSELLASERGNELKSFWDHQLAGALPVLDLPTDRPRPAAQSFAGRTYDQSLDRDLAERVNRLARSMGVTPYVVMLSAFMALLHRYSQQNDIIVGTPMSGRSRPEFEEVVGYFTNPMPIRTSVSDQTPFSSLLAQVRQGVLDAIEHADLPFPVIVDRLQPVRDQSRSPILPAAFTWDKVSAPAGVDALDLKFVMGTQMGSNFDLDLIVLDEDASLRAVWRYSTQLFEEATIACMHTHYTRILESILESPAMRLADLPLNSAAERQQLLDAWNPSEKAATPRPGSSLVNRFEEQVRRTPDAQAVSCEGETLTYAELNERANRLAERLRQRGVAAGDIVALFVERSVTLVAGIVGILKAGAAYLPIDPAYPVDRARFMIEDARAVVLLTQTSLWPDAGDSTLLLDQDSGGSDGKHTSFASREIDPDALAYVIYTSGSTGRPKGVGVTHRQVARLFESTASWFKFGSTDVWTCFHSAAFDFSVWEIWGALLHGGRLIVVPFWASRSPEAFRRLLSDERVTVLNQTPSAFYQLMEADAHAGDAPLALRFVVFGGEALNVRSLRPWVARHGAVMPQLVNMYGITETTVHVTYRPLTESDVLSGAGSVIGQPIPDLTVYVLDSTFEPIPVGIRGELFVGGAGVTNGYLGQPRLTAERFVPDPFGSTPGARLYRSGDLARRLSNGDLEYLGRADQQVKVRGFRIELGEVETAIKAHPAVQDAVVIGSDQRLVAYVVPRTTVAGPVRRLIAWERDRRLGDRSWYELPNGLAIVHLNRNETDFLYGEIFESGRYLDKGVDLEPGACVFDVGANIGMFTLLVGQRCPGARIFAFEPIPPVCALLALNAELHGLDVQVEACGLSAAEGEAEFTYYPNMSILSGRFADSQTERGVVEAFLKNQSAAAASSALLDELLEDRLKAETVTSRLTTVSAVMREHAIDRIDLLKVDVEKSELAVLEGVDAADWPKIRQVIAEVHDEHGRLGAVVALLERYGFSVSSDQDATLTGTGLHNVYAIRGEQRPSRPAAPSLTDWSSPTRLAADLRQSLHRSLPEYMIPAECVLIDALPLTSNGKLDRGALPNAAPSRRERIMPRTGLEQEIAGIWCEVLHLETVSIHDDFFELGGHSLLATKVISRLRGTLGVTVPLRTLFDHPTVEALALAVVAKQAEEVDPEVWRRALAEIEGLR